MEKNSITNKEKELKKRGTKKYEKRKDKEEKILLIHPAHLGISQTFFEPSHQFSSFGITTLQIP